MATYLDGILAAHRARAAADSRGIAALEAIAAAGPAPRPFRRALGEAPGVALIAEIKRRSPSRGDLAVNLDPARVARAYEAGGATCLSVLTDGPHFGGSREDLVAARAAVGLPVLRKDFTVAACDLYDARAMGADAVLLIVAALRDVELRGFLALARDLALDALVEVHDDGELERALEAGAELVGVNQRDLRSFAVDPELALRVGARIPPGVLKVAESGITGAAEVERLAAAGFDAVLVGEALVRASDPTDAARALLGAARGAGAR